MPLFGISPMLVVHCNIITIHIKNDYGKCSLKLWHTQGIFLGNAHYNLWDKSIGGLNWPTHIRGRGYRILSNAESRQLDISIQ